MHHRPQNKNKRLQVAGGALGAFTNHEKDSEKLEDLEKINKKDLKKFIIPVEEAIKEIFESVQVKDKCVKQLLTGKPVHNEDLVNEKKVGTNKLINIFNNDKFIWFFEILNEEVFAKAKFVLQEIK